MVTLLYILFIGLVIFIFSNILPKIGLEVGSFLKDASNTTHQVQDFIQRIEAATNLNLGLDKLAGDFVNQSNLEAFAQSTL